MYSQRAGIGGSRQYYRFTTSPLSGVLNGFGPIGIPGGQLSSGHRYQRISQAYP